MKRSILTFVILVLTGCQHTRYEYTPPVTDQGMRCISRCQDQRQDCRANEKENARIERNRCEKQALIDYDYCMDHAEFDYRMCRRESARKYEHCLKTSKDPNACRKEECRKSHCFKTTCFDSAHYYHCENRFRKCYQECGGIVEKIVEDR